MGVIWVVKILNTQVLKIGTAPLIRIYKIKLGSDIIFSSLNIGLHEYFHLANDIIHLS